MSPVDRGLVKSQVGAHTYKGGSWFKFKAGPNPIRILTFKRKITPLDVAAGRAREDQLGSIIETFFVSGHRLWRSDKRYTVCLPDKDKCPIWQQFFNLPSDMPKNEKKKYRPTDFFAVNIIDLEHPEKGVQVLELGRAMFLGERDMQRQRKGYGILDYFQGYTPGNGDDDAGEKAENPYGEYKVEGGLSAMRKLDPLWDELVGLDGRDIIICCVEKETGFGRVMRLNHDLEHGAIVLRSKADSEKFPAKFQEQVRDLYGMARFYPGYCSTGAAEDFLWPNAIEMARIEESMKEEYKEEREETQQQQEAEELDPTQYQTTTEEAKPEPDPTNDESDSILLGRLQPEDKVYWVDKMNADNTRRLAERNWKWYVARFQGWEGGMAQITLHPSDQKDDKLAKVLEGAMKDAGLEEIPAYEVNKDDLMPIRD